MFKINDKVIVKMFKKWTVIGYITKNSEYTGETYEGTIIDKQYNNAQKKQQYTVFLKKEKINVIVNEEDLVLKEE